MFARQRFASVAGAFVLGQMLAASPARATRSWTDPDAPRARSIVAPARAWFGGGSERWAPERPHVFLAGGYALISTESLVNAWLLPGWNATGGVELPVGKSWTLVPRVHFSGANGDNTGNILWARLALDGRLSTSRGGVITYYEAGPGFGVIDSPVSVTGADFSSHSEQRTSGTPFLQIVSGLRGDPDQAPAFMTELIFVLGLGAERPGTLEWVVGIEF